MKKISSKRLLLLLLIGLVFQGKPASAAKVLKISLVTPLAFGRVAASSAGTVTISPTGIRTVTGGVVPLSLPSWGAASFTITGANSTAYTITLPSSVTLTSGSNTVTIDNLVSVPSGTGMLSASGAQTLQVGGRLNFSGAQVAGSYTGTVTVNVAY